MYHGMLGGRPSPTGGGGELTTVVSVSLAWIRVVDVMGFGLRSMPFYQAKAAKEPTDTAYFRHQHGEYRWEWAGFRFCKGWQTLYPIEFWCVPYWAITIPLTLLSAWLFVAKPRKRESGPTDR